MQSDENIGPIIEPRVSADIDSLLSMYGTVCINDISRGIPATRDVHHTSNV